MTQKIKERQFQYGTIIEKIRYENDKSIVKVDFDKLIPIEENIKLAIDLQAEIRKQTTVEEEDKLIFFISNHQKSNFPLLLLAPGINENFLTKIILKNTFFLKNDIEKFKKIDFMNLSEFFLLDTNLKFNHLKAKRMQKLSKLYYECPDQYDIKITHNDFSELEKFSNLNDISIMNNSPSKKFLKKLITHCKIVKIDFIFYKMYLENREDGLIELSTSTEDYIFNNFVFFDKKPLIHRFTIEKESFNDAIKEFTPLTIEDLEMAIYWIEKYTIHRTFSIEFYRNYLDNLKNNASNSIKEFDDTSSNNN